MARIFYVIPWQKGDSMCKGGQEKGFILKCKSRNIQLLHPTIHYYHGDVNVTKVRSWDQEQQTAKARRRCTSCNDLIMWTWVWSRTWSYLFLIVGNQISGKSYMLEVL